MGMIPVSTIVITLTITSSMAADSMPKCLECMEVLGGLYADTQQGLLYPVGCYALWTLRNNMKTKYAVDAEYFISPGNLPK